ncbi:MAG: ABC transporter substrate-binding protein, partial [Gammaproteobacteria bacterium]|nr:ABC transporter substrate-binding protein [Gammaproteobacteria bacterium]
KQHKVQVLQLPNDVLHQLHILSNDVVAEVADRNKMARKVYDSVLKFKDTALAWHNISERAYLNAREA